MEILWNPRTSFLVPRTPASLRSAPLASRGRRAPVASPEGLAPEAPWRPEQGRLGTTKEVLVLQDFCRTSRISTKDFYRISRISTQDFLGFLQRSIKHYLEVLSFYQDFTRKLKLPKTAQGVPGLPGTSQEVLGSQNPSQNLAQIQSKSKSNQNPHRILIEILGNPNKS